MLTEQEKQMTGDDFALVAITEPHTADTAAQPDEREEVFILINRAETIEEEEEEEEEFVTITKSEATDEDFMVVKSLESRS